MLRSADRGWLTREAAWDVYRVALRERDDEPGCWAIDEAATAALRAWSRGSGRHARSLAAV